MATNSLGRLTLDLVVQTASFTEPLSKAERQARTSSQGMASSLNIAAIAVSALGGAIAGLSIANLVSYSEKVIQTGSDIQRFSKLANASVKDFQYFSKGAESAGISMESFADKMKDMQDRIGDFQQTGGGPLADFFENIAPRVGVTIQQFQKLSGPDALQLFYNSIEKAGASTNDMKFYMEAIISDSSLLIPLLENGGKGFKEYGEAAKKAGAIMTDELAANLAEAKKQMMLMDLQWQGLEYRMINNVVPAIKMVVDNWSEIKAVTIAVAAGIAARFVPALVVATYQLGQTAIFALRAQVGLFSFARTAGATTGVLALLGGPAGLGMLAAQLVVAGGAYYLMTQQTKDTTEALSDQGLTVDELKEKYKKLNAEQLKIKSLDVADAISKQKKIIEETYAQLDRRVYNILTGAGTEKQAGALQQYIDDLKAGGDRAAQALNVLSSTNVFNDNQLRSIADFGLKIKGATDEIQRQKDIQSLVKDATDATTKAQESQAKAVNNTAKEWMALTQRQREALTAMKNDALRDQYIKNTMQNGWTRDQAEAFAKYRDSAGIGFSNKDNLTPLERNSVIESFNRKNYTFGKEDLKAIAKVQGIAKVHNFAKIEGLYGLPAGTLAAYVLGESGGDENARSPTGATGLFQTTSIFRRNYREILSKGNNSVEAQATAIADAIALGLKEFGSMDKALMSINAGITGTYRYIDGNIGTGKGQMSPKKAKEVAGYYPKFAKYFSAVNGKSTVDDSLLMPTQADQLELINKAAESQKLIDDAKKEVDARYYTEAQRLAKEHKDNVEKITLAYAGTPQLKEKLAQEDALYAAQLAKLESDKKEEYNQYFAFETDRIKQIEQNYDRQKELIDSNAEYEYGKSKKALEIKAALDRQKQKEIEWEKLEQQQRLNDASSFLNTELQNMRIRFAYEREQILRNSEISKEEQKQRIELKKAEEQLSLIDKASQASIAWDSTNASLNGSSDVYQIEQQRLAQNAQSLALANAQAALTESATEQEAIWQAHKDRMFMIDQNYELNKAALGAKMASETLGSMADLMGGLMGEQSAAYKTMFAMSKAFAVAQAIMNAPKTYSDVYASIAAIPMIGPYIAPVMAGAAVAVQVAQAAQIKSVNLTGMAHDGIGNVPKEGTWLLDGGERVLNPEQNKDLTSYLNNRKDNMPQVVINNYSKANVETSVEEGKLYVAIDDIYNPNSKYSQAMQESFNISRKRG
ncbi:transglycosylase SLT domain-containing protein [Acinetobacter seifertii]|uniref:Transglycosylase SLT domain-containing protein n=1 Tax=Acinetobacter seifertii TaxID=1530123 RepID=A0A7H2UPB9_9GAMM|nr:transglycosylase SLT domain-containing protein [Acinetobacter seifertii]QNX27997.1 transglycosylase SLT domain-containing protein [Acinetobacter seifertii]QNX43506.1 transglycosylase SLT domain-containing protein [Acinetobacter seifertii]QNX50728.1 transglycosylase SLT domain-containing protein [Acinetobacter seifertii]QNX58230.1 transglycosylase SLT domain-containing protein [Acinetobacter seifertii]QNX58270.1 transglycosylase SLT domain-containing protein [Acinetobacter seifertii]